MFQTYPFLIFYCQSWKSKETKLKENGTIDSMYFSTVSQRRIRCIPSVLQEGFGMECKTIFSHMKLSSSTMIDDYSHIGLFTDRLWVCYIFVKQIFHCLKHLSTFTTSKVHRDGRPRTAEFETIPQSTP